MKKRSLSKILSAIIIFLISFFIKGEISYAESNSPYIVSFCIEQECSEQDKIMELIDLCMEEAFERNADFVVLPFFESIYGDTIASTLSILAEEREVWIFYGAKEEIINSELTYDAVYIVNPEGMITTYECMSSSDGENGNSPCIVHTEFGDIGIAGKNDLYLVPELSRYYTAMGCRTVINPMSVCEEAEWTESIMERDGSKILYSRFEESALEGNEEFEIEVSRNHVNLTKTVYSDVSGNNFKEELYSEWYADVANDLHTDDISEVLIPNMKTVNYTPVWGDISRNLQKMKKEIDAAYEDDVDIIVFPEMALQGYCYSESSSSESHNMPIREAIDFNSDSILELSALSAEYQMYIVFGSSEIAYDEDGNRRKKAYNSAFVCCPDGRILSYRKIHTVEGTWCLSGKDPLYFDTEFGKIGIGICKDSFAYPELARFYCGKECTYYINLSASSYTSGMSWKEYYQSRLQMTADASSMTVISSNINGTQYDANGVSHGRFGGNSGIFYPVYDSSEISYQADLYSQMYQVLEGSLDHERLVMKSEVSLIKSYCSPESIAEYAESGETILYAYQYQIQNVKTDSYTGYQVKQFLPILVQEQQIEEQIPDQTFLNLHLLFCNEDGMTEYDYKYENRTVSFQTDKPGTYLFILYYDTKKEYLYLKYLQEFRIRKEFINIFS